jgi:hypothetical protein
MLALHACGSRFDSPTLKKRKGEERGRRTEEKKKRKIRVGKQAKT